MGLQSTLTTDIWSKDKILRGLLPYTKFSTTTFTSLQYTKSST